MQTSSGWFNRIREHEGAPGVREIGSVTSREAEKTKHSKERKDVSIQLARFLRWLSPRFSWERLPRVVNARGSIRGSFCPRPIRNLESAVTARGGRTNREMILRCSSLRPIYRPLFHLDVINSCLLSVVSVSQLEEAQSFPASEDNSSHRIISSQIVSPPNSTRLTVLLLLLALRLVYLYPKYNTISCYNKALPRS